MPHPTDDLPILHADTRGAPPHWALLQRRLFDLLDSAALEFADRYARPDGTLYWRESWPGMDGSDDPYEGFMNMPLLYALGGSEQVLARARTIWDGITWQWTQYGQVHDEFDAYYDWMHHGEGYLFQYFMGFTDPSGLKDRQRAEKFAALYTEPEAGNWDPEKLLIRSPISGSRGARFVQTAEDWETHREILDNYLPPFEDLPGIDASAKSCPWSDDSVYAQILERINQRQARGDVPLNLAATSMATHAFLHSGRPELRDWVLAYHAAWAERAKRNGGIIPDNVGLSGEIGEYNDGKWWGGYYGWRWPHGAFSILEPLSIAATNGVLLTGDMRQLDLARSQLDMLWDLRREEDGKILVPNRHYDAGWRDWRVQHPMYGIYLWLMSFDEADAARAERGWAAQFDTIDTGFSSYGRQSTGGHMGFNGNTAQWFAYIRGRDPGYPVRRLETTLASVAEQIANFRSDANDPLTMDHYRESMSIHMWQDLTPVLIEALVQTTMGAPMHVYHGGLQHGTLRHFDAEARRPGLPPGVGALVEAIGVDFARVTFCNTDPQRAREVIVQAGSFGEHRFTSARIEGEADAVPVGGKWFRLALAPGALVKLELGLERFVATPSYETPWHAIADGPVPLRGRVT
ncbi:hypothetical protein EMQ25_14160 [Arsenicitalea aurantiaca]|uniref:Uncharacterized protein n=1 Tax=Arsenicitalea aurantiaca TaxID=1783274 RepID=A0A433X5E2_9HYPH|nr:hypothetical protein [Arsenicitalea aurantiaca]RUT29267.1 hypothetical protein EMQ25_14160 [Arsenicitalea aurantiaca]